MTDKTLIEVLEEYQKARRELENDLWRLQQAKRSETEARHRVSLLQDRISDEIEMMKRAAPAGTEWSREIEKRDEKDSKS